MNGGELSWSMFLTIVGASGREGSLNVEAVHAWQPDVQNQARGAVRWRAAKELLRGAEGFRLQAGRFQQTRNRLTHVGIVVDYEYR